MIDALRNEYSVVILLHVYSLVWPVPATHIPGRLPSPSSPFGFTSNTSQSGSFVTQMWHYDFQELYLLALFFFFVDESVLCPRHNFATWASINFRG